MNSRGITGVKTLQVRDKGAGLEGRVSHTGALLENRDITVPRTLQVGDKRLG